jgi:hypothetical protein
LFIADLFHPVGGLAVKLLPEGCEPLRLISIS